MHIRRGRGSRPPCTGSKNVLAVKVRLAHRGNTGKKDEEQGSYHAQLRSRSSSRQAAGIAGPWVDTRRRLGCYLVWASHVAVVNKCRAHRMLGQIDVREGAHTGLALNRRDRVGRAPTAPHKKPGSPTAHANDDAAVATPRIGRGDF
jgi:hypothetical protein